MRQTTPLLAEHQTVMAQLPKTLNRSYRYKISQFLCHLEQQGLRWSALAPAAGEKRPAALETAVNTAIQDHGLNKNTRAALNRGFNLTLVGPSGQVRLTPALPEHQTVMAQLPKTLDRSYRAKISRFLCHLEQQDQRWSTLAPAADEKRTAALEAAVNTAIKDHGLDQNTRAALNQGFNLTLVGPSGWVRLKPLLAEHQTVMAQLPQSFDHRYRSYISRFLYLLEQQDQLWSALAPAAGEKRPAALEAVVNAAMQHHGLDPSTRAALNNGFNLALVGPSGQVRLAPVQPEHQTVMAQLPKSLSSAYRSNISRFLCHLEQQGQLWSALAPAAGDRRPAALETAINTAIQEKRLDPGTRAALNHGFNLALVGPSGRPQLTPVQPEHQTMMAQLPESLGRSYRYCISRFLCHLEQQDQRWSVLAPFADDIRPAALEAAVNTAIKDHGLASHTRAAINRGFMLKLKAPSWR
ncbi:hypothetical protein [Pseudomonas sp. FP1740]|uniref:hypothetical protein n=1 Tax=Pseudomonas sp. FP1740 TaxID=2954078 RepID=UPI002733F9A8|nr:hypothetical protein [Pseudomonas sp. FP1740]WLG43190.1 hypothetical protein PSH69_20250 [Pseudomonas sp. FP1740]